MNKQRTLRRISTVEKAIEVLQAELAELRAELETSDDRQAPTSALTTRIVELLRNNPRRTFDAEEIRQALKIDETKMRSLRTTLSSLVDKERITTPRRGLYQIVKKR